MPRFRYMTWTHAGFEETGDIPAADIRDASRQLKIKMKHTPRQEFVIWPRGTPRPSRNKESPLFD